MKDFFKFVILTFFVCSSKIALSSDNLGGGATWTKTELNYYKSLIPKLPKPNFGERWLDPVGHSKYRIDYSWTGIYELNKEKGYQRIDKEGDKVKHLIVRAHDGAIRLYNKEGKFYYLKKESEERVSKEPFAPKWTVDKIVSKFYSPSKKDSKEASRAERASSSKFQSYSLSSGKKEASRAERASSSKFQSYSLSSGKEETETPEEESSPAKTFSDRTNYDALAKKTEPITVESEYYESVIDTLPHPCSFPLNYGPFDLRENKPSTNFYLVNLLKSLEGKTVRRRRTVKKATGESLIEKILKDSRFQEAKKKAGIYNYSPKNGFTRVDKEGDNIRHFILRLSRK